MLAWLGAFDLSLMNGWASKTPAWARSVGYPAQGREGAWVGIVMLLGLR